jgi:hypothetical protein
VWISAVEGGVEPVFQGGMQIGFKRKFSDAMRAKLLEGLLPETFDRRALQRPAANINIKFSAAQIAAVVRRLSPTRQRDVIEVPVETLPDCKSENPSA